MDKNDSQSKLDNYKRLEKLGEGTYGVVYKAIDLETNEVVAMKKIRLDSQEEGMPSTSLREISILRELTKHPNVVKLLRVIYTNPYRIYLVFEFLYMDLKKYFDSVESVDPLLTKSYMYQMLRALEYCHSRRIIHRDLKPQNLLIDEQGLIKLADFGLARAVSIPIRAYTHEIVTLWYRCPEVLLGVPRYSPAVDMWSIGCIFAELATTQPIFHGDSEIDQLFKIFQILGTPNDTIWPHMTSLPNYKSTFPTWPIIDFSDRFSEIGADGLDLFKELVVYDPAKRISAKRALLHSYFHDYDSTLLPQVDSSF